MNDHFTDEQIKAYASQIRPGDAIYFNGKWHEVFEVNLGGKNRVIPYGYGNGNGFTINLGISDSFKPLSSGFGTLPDNPYRVTTLEDYELQGGEYVIWLGGSDSLRKFGKAYGTERTKSGIVYRDNEGELRLATGNLWGVIPRYEQVKNLGKTTITEQVNVVVKDKMSAPQKVEVSFDEMAIQTEIITRLLKQTAKGVKKYGEPVQHGNLTAIEWIDHAIDESIDQITYLTALKHSLQDKEGK